MCRWTGYGFQGLESSEYTISPLSVLKRVSFCTGSLLDSVCVSCLKQGTKWAIFVLTRVGVWRSRRHSSTQTSFECPPRKVRKFGGNWREGTASQFREWKFITLPFWFSTVLACVAGAKRRGGGGGRGGGDKSAKGKRESLNKPLSATPSLFPFLPIPQPIKSRH